MLQQVSGNSKKAKETKHPAARPGIVANWPVKYLKNKDLVVCQRPPHVGKVANNNHQD
jgi:hypothetical protein